MHYCANAHAYATHAHTDENGVFVRLQHWDKEYASTVRAKLRITYAQIQRIYEVSVGTGTRSLPSKHLYLHSPLEHTHARTGRQVLKLAQLDSGDSKAVAAYQKELKMRLLRQNAEKLTLSSPHREARIENLQHMSVVGVVLCARLCSPFPALI